MPTGQKLVWAAIFAALATGLLVSLVVGRARSFEQGGRDFRVLASLLGLGLFVIVLVAVAFVAGYAGIDNRYNYILICVSVLGVGAVLYADVTRSRAATPERSSAVPLREPAIDVAPFEYSFVASNDEHSAEVLAAAARAEASFSRSSDLAADAPSPQRSRALVPTRS